MAGQGVNMGFADVECLVKILEEAIRNGADFSRKFFFFAEVFQNHHL
jgi:2-polyprenyl-6-methoxyphenol hydroxylase-like FAD-dependent oxidoreductase